MTLYAGCVYWSLVKWNGKIFQMFTVLAPVYCTVHLQSNETETAALLGDQVFGPAPFSTFSSRPLSPCCSKCSLTTHHTSQTEKITSPATPRDTFSPNFKDLQNQQTRNLTRIRSPHLDNLSFGPPSPKRLSTAIAETWFPGCHGRD